MPERRKTNQSLGAARPAENLGGRRNEDGRPKPTLRVPGTTSLNSGRVGRSCLSPARAPCSARNWADNGESSVGRVGVQEMLEGGKVLFRFEIRPD